MNDGKFTTGLLLGLILGGGAVFLLGTRTGKNLLKILSEQGMDGLVNLLQEYDLENLEEESFDSAQDLDKSREPDVQEEKVEKSSYTKASEEQEKPELPKKHFFKRIKK